MCTAQKRQFHAPKGPQHARSGHISASRKCNENLHLHVEMPYCCIPPIRSASTRSKYHRGSQCKNNPSCHCKSSTLPCRHHNKVDGSLVVKASHPTDKKRHCIPEAWTPTLSQLHCTPGAWTPIPSQDQSNHTNKNSTVRQYQHPGPCRSGQDTSPWSLPSNSRTPDHYKT